MKRTTSMVMLVIVLGATCLTGMERQKSDEFEAVEVFNWDGLANELKVHILSSIVNTHDAIAAIDAQDDRFFITLRQYAILRSTSKTMQDLVSIVLIFDLNSIIEHLLRQQNQSLAPIEKLLVVAAKHGRIDILNLLIGRGLIVSNKNYLEITAASLYRQTQFCEELIRQGIFDGATNAPLLCAIYLHKYDTVWALIHDNKMNSTLIDGSNEIILAARINDVEILELLLNTSPHKINAKDHGGSTALHCAAYEGYRGVVELLLDKGADIDVEEALGLTPLHMASSEGHIEVVKLLLDRGADIKHETKYGISPITIAIMMQRSDVIECLNNRLSLHN